jgi:hypothetical protein
VRSPEGGIRATFEIGDDEGYLVRSTGEPRVGGGERSKHPELREGGA